MKKRSKIVSNFIEELAFSSNLDSRKRVKLVCGVSPDLFELIPNADAHTMSIAFPKLFLLNLEELGEKFKIGSLEELDRRLESDPKWLQDLADRLALIYESPSIRVNAEHREAVRLMVRYLFKDGQVPEEALYGVKFSLLHEIGHLHHDHSYPPQQKKWMVIGGGVAAVIAFAVYFALSATLFGLIITVPLAFIVGAYATKKIREIKHDHKCEREADLFASQSLKDDPEERVKVLRGGRYLFETIRTHQLELLKNSQLPWKERLKYYFMISPEGNNRLFYLTHPSEIARIKNIKKEEEESELSFNQ